MIDKEETVARVCADLKTQLESKVLAYISDQKAELNWAVRNTGDKEDTAERLCLVVYSAYTTGYMAGGAVSLELIDTIAKAYDEEARNG